MKLPRNPVKTGRYFYQNATLLSTLSESIVPSTTPWGSRFEDTLKTFHLILLAVCVSQIHTGESREFHFYLSFFFFQFYQSKIGFIYFPLSLNFRSPWLASLYFYFIGNVWIHLSPSWLPLGIREVEEILTEDLQIICFELISFCFILFFLNVNLERQ